MLQTESMLPKGSLKHIKRRRAETIYWQQSPQIHVCENVCQDRRTCANKRVKDEVILFDLSVVGHDEWQPSIHTGVPYEMSVLHTVGANQFTLSVRYLVQEFVKIKMVELHITSYWSYAKQKWNASHPSAKIDVVWMLRDVVGVCAVIFQQAEDVLRALQAHCAFKRQIVHSLVRESRTIHFTHTHSKDAYTSHIYVMCM